MISVPTRKNADLSVRAASAAIMLALTAAAWWAGGVWLDGFIGAVAFVTFVEFLLLVVKATQNIPFRFAALIGGGVYIGLAAAVLIGLDQAVVLLPVVAVIFVDTFAYAFGRTIGGPKLIPAISPNKTWAGLAGGIAGSTICLWLAYLYGYSLVTPTRVDWADMFANAPVWQIHISGVIVAVLAQAGDLFQSWLKRRAGVKDSSHLIPGHGGVFDRTDGLLPVAILTGALFSFGL